MYGTVYTKVFQTIPDSRRAAVTLHAIPDQTSVVMEPLLSADDAEHNGDIMDQINVEGRTNKRSVYEPSGSQRCKQIVCSQGRAIVIATLIAVLVISIALIASFARPGGATACNKVATTEAPPAPKPTPAIATNGEPFPYKSIRLPRSIIPLQYDIFLHPNLTTFLYSGSVNITLKVNKTTNFIVLHLRELNITAVRLHSVESLVGITILKTLEYVNHQQLYIEVDGILPEGQELILAIDFKGVISKIINGFYRSSYVTKTGERRFLATTDFEPTNARRAFPCFDEPAFKANFSMTMVRDKDHISLFNMPLKTTMPYGGQGLFADHFQTSVKMSTYLVAFVVCDFPRIQAKTKRNITVSVYTPPDVIDQAKFALEVAVKVIDYYEKFFGVEYPLPKQDLIAIPDFTSGAMENWGLITYRMTSLLFDEQESSSDNKQRVAVVVAHELAHQWFGNLVTMKWWDDLWLNEGFASYVEFLGVNAVKPEWKMNDQFITESLDRALRLDGLQNSHPISIPVKSPDQITSVFDNISYNKGASLIRMLKYFVGDDTLRRGLQYYLSKHRYGNTVTKDLWDAITKAEQEVSGGTRSIASVMDTWTKQMGYPLVTLTRQAGDKFHATQTRFLLYSKGNASSDFVSPYGYKWQIPLTYITQQTPKQSQQVWMQEGPVGFSVAAGNTWIKANVNMSGFYRVMYDQRTWFQLINQMLVNHTVFSPSDRASLIDDAFAISRAGLYNVTNVLEMSKYLSAETEYVPWSIAADSFGYIAMMLRHKPAFQYYKTYFLRLIKEQISDLGWKDEGPHLTKQLRSLILSEAVSLGDKASIAQARALFLQWKNGSKLAPNLKNIVYKAGIMYGNEEDWNYMWKKYQETKVPSEKSKFQFALATTPNGELLNRYLEFSLMREYVRDGDTVSVVCGVARNAAGRDSALLFVMRHWGEFRKRYGKQAFELSGLVKCIGGHFNTQFDHDLLKNFYDSVDLASALRASTQVLESIEMNIAWATKNMDAVISWLKQQ